MKDKKLNAVPVCKQSKEGRALGSSPRELSSQAGQAEACLDGAATSPAKSVEVDAKLVWKQFEDQLVPRLGLSLTERAVYSHLLRHSHLEGKRHIHFTMKKLAAGMGLCDNAVRPAVRLIDHGALRLLRKCRAGHVVEVRLPEQIRAARRDPFKGRKPSWKTCNLGEVDFFNKRPLRQAIHAREQGRCFYCLRRIPSGAQELDHVVPQAKGGSNSYRNLVSACLDCNSAKGDRSATDFLRELYREGRLTAKELTGRLQALEDLAAGNLRPVLPA